MHPAARDRLIIKAELADEADEEVVPPPPVGDRLGANVSGGKFDGIGTGADEGVRVVGSDVG